MPENLADQRDEISLSHAAGPRRAKADRIEKPLVRGGQHAAERGKFGPRIKGMRDLNETAVGHVRGLAKPGPSGLKGDSTTAPTASRRTCGSRIPSDSAASMSMSAANSDSSAARWRAGRKLSRIRRCVTAVRDAASNRVSGIRAGRGEGWLAAQGFLGVGARGTATPLPVRLTDEFVQCPASFRIEVDVPAFRLVRRLEQADDPTVLYAGRRRLRTTMSRSSAAEMRQRGAEALGGRTCRPWLPGRVLLARCRLR